MAWLNNTPIGLRMAAAFALTLLATLTMGLLDWHGMRTLSAIADAMYKDQLITVANINEANQQAIYFDRVLYDYVIQDEMGEMDADKKQLDENERQMNATLDDYRKTDMSEDEQKFLSTLDAGWKEYRAVAE